MQTDARARDTCGRCSHRTPGRLPRDAVGRVGQVGWSPTPLQAPPPSAARRKSSRAGVKLNPPLGCPRSTIFIPRNQLCLGPKPASLWDGENFSQGCSLVILLSQPQGSGSTKKQGL